MAICVTPRLELPSIHTLPFMDYVPTKGQIPKPIEIVIPQKPINETKSNKIHIRGSWSQEEDQLLTKAVLSQSPILWDLVAEQVPGRTAIQCKERWLYRLHPEVKKTRFEKWEDDLIIAERMKHGNHWTLIATKLPGRTSCAVKNRWYSVLRNKINAPGLDESC